MNDKSKAAWADEPVPLCDENCWVLEDDQHPTEYYVRVDFARDLERRLRHAWKLVNSLRIDAMHAHDPAPEWQLDPELLEQRLADVEETLQP